MKTKTPNLDFVKNQNRICKLVFHQLQNREFNPSGGFDKAGRWWAEHDHLINVRSPSRAFPYSHMVACRTLKYVKAVCVEFHCTTITALRAIV